MHQILYNLSQGLLPSLLIICSQVAKDEAVTHMMKKEKEIVVRKMTEMEEELKVNFK